VAGAAARAESVLAATVLAAAAVLLAAVVGGPLTGGWRVAPVRSGSMAPAIPAGALVLSRPEPAQNVRPGWVITFHRPGDRAVVTHRVARVLAGGRRPVVETRGDANATVDPWRVRLVGGRVWRAWVVVPALGRVLLVLRTRPLRLATTAGVPLLLGLWGAAAVLRGPRGTARGAGRAAASPAGARRPSGVGGRGTGGTVGAAGAAVPPLAWAWTRAADDLLPGRPALPAAPGPRRGAAWAVAAGAVALALGLAPAAHAVAGDAAAVAQAPIATDTLLAPTGLSASGGCGGLGQGPRVVLSWTPTTSTYATGYGVWRATASGGPYTKVADVAGRTTSSWTDWSVSLGRTYWYRLQAAFAAWTSADSAPASASTPVLCL
jgi:signal peptidase I